MDLPQTVGGHSIHPQFVHEKSRLSPIVTGATVVGLKYKDGVILAADTLALGDSGCGMLPGVGVDSGAK